ncbi:MAG: serine/threonine-protein kinase [Polyangiaceae bacterium]
MPFPTPRSAGVLVGERAYRLGAHVASGGFGAVFHGVEVDTGRDVAIKVLAPPWDGERRARFAREARLARGIRHPSVVRVLDSGDAPDGAPFIVFEWLEGVPLSAKLERGEGLPLDLVAHVGRELLGALEAIHALGIVHRDVKPANILLSGATPPRVSLLDLGVARPMVASRALTEDGAMVSSLPYMAPEQLDGASVTPAADLYALGLVLAEMIGGQRIYWGRAVAICADKLRRPPPFTRVHQRSPLWPAIERATRARPDERPASAAEMRALMEAPRRAGTEARARPPTRSRARHWIGAICAFMLGAGIALALIAWRGAQPRPRASAPRRARVADAGPAAEAPVDLSPRACPGVDRLAPEAARAWFFADGEEPESGTREFPGQVVHWWLRSDRQVTFYDFSSAGTSHPTAAESVDVQSGSAAAAGRLALRGATKVLAVRAPSGLIDAFERRYCP